MDNDQTIINIHAYLSGQMSELERKGFQAWVDENSANRQLFEAYHEAWILSESYNAPSFSREGVRSRMPFIKDINQPSLSTPAESRPIIRIRRWTVAASVLVLVAAGIWIMNAMNDDTLLAMGKTTSELDLEDGSVVHLRRDARLEYPKEFSSGNRIVELEEGEAYFDIARDASRRFIVETEYADITVLGTEFDVDIDEGFLEVHVAEGKVRIDPEDSDLYLELTAGQSAYFDYRTGELKRERSVDMNEIAWYTKRLSFKNEKLSEVVKVIEETFEVDIEVENADLQDCKVTATNHNDTQLTDILVAIVQIWDCKVIQKDDNSYILRGGSCN